MKHLDCVDRGVDLDAVRRAIEQWYVRAHRSLPWRNARDPYSIWISETMLQQTRVETVLPYYERFMREFPDVRSLAEAPRERVMSAWSGLGYYRRVRMLHEAARKVLDDWGGRVPGDLEDLRRLPGVGPYTAGAIASIAYGRRVPLVDGNVKRVLARVFAVELDLACARGSSRIWDLAERFVAPPGIDPGILNQGLMELGATVCLPRRPRCDDCPLRRHCVALSTGQTRDLPRVVPKRASLAVSQTALVVASERRIVLARRPPSGLFGGLWEPPSTEGDVVALAARCRISDSEIRAAGSVEHVLTHRNMHVSVVLAPLGRRRTFPSLAPEYDAVEVLEWTMVDRYAHSALTLKVLNLATGVLAGLR